MHRYVAAFAFVSALMSAVPAFAQERGKVGMTLGYPASIGILWHAREKVALRPELSVAWSSTDSDTGILESDGNSIATGVSALFYLGRRDDLATYVSPRYTFSRSSSTASGILGAEIERVSTTHFLSGSFGAQYFMSDRFSAFGEFGIGYSTSDSDPPTVSSKTVGTRTAVGLVLYF